MADVKPGKFASETLNNRSPPLLLYFGKVYGHSFAQLWNFDLFLVKIQHFKKQYLKFRSNQIKLDKSNALNYSIVFRFFLENIFSRKTE